MSTETVEAVPELWWHPEHSVVMPVVVEGEDYGWYVLERQTWLDERPAGAIRLTSVVTGLDEGRAVRKLRQYASTLESEATVAAGAAYRLGLIPAKMRTAAESEARTVGADTADRLGLIAAKMRAAADKCAPASGGLLSIVRRLSTMPASEMGRWYFEDDDEATYTDEDIAVRLRAAADLTCPVGPAPVSPDEAEAATRDVVGVRGRCPECRHMRLVVDHSGGLRCTADYCPDPGAAADLMMWPPTVSSR